MTANDIKDFMMGRKGMMVILSIIIILLVVALVVEFMSSKEGYNRGQTLQILSKEGYNTNRGDMVFPNNWEYLSPQTSNSAPKAFVETVKTVAEDIASQALNQIDDLKKDSIVPDGDQHISIASSPGDVARIDDTRTVIQNNAPIVNPQEAFASTRTLQNYSYILPSTLTAAKIAQVDGQSMETYDMQDFVHNHPNFAKF